MVFEEIVLSGAFVIKPERISDDRGFFARAYCQDEFRKLGLATEMAQCNIAYNRYQKTLRGMHFQASPFEEVKIVRCTKGKIFDVIVDLRQASPTYLQWYGVELTEHNRKILYVPKQFAHGYYTLTHDTEVFYQVSQSYAPQAERGLRWNDPAVGIKWPNPSDDIIISPKDRNWPDWIR